MISAFGVEHGDISKSRDHKKGAKRGAAIGGTASAAYGTAFVPGGLKRTFAKPKFHGMPKGKKAAVGVLTTAGTAALFGAPGAAAGGGIGAAIGRKKK